VYEADGHLKGNLDVQTVACSGGKCPVKVPAPAAALVFLNDQAFAASNPTTTSAVASGTGAAVSASASKTPSAKGTVDSDPRNAAVGVQATMCLLVATAIVAAVNLI
jgi:hypothetical protein